ncbi:uncharacterized protein LOC21399864 isoform X2 [Morus notabilis]|uniref:uncharacterized protein LOC21399864 isoform X2 n=1 Tax=Morus notabilis TaxID=981085 RepID=UPI000CED358A|nr:uncharacterized protein LOC21399864 isoform X2 [Morus notabilis]
MAASEFFLMSVLLALTFTAIEAELPLPNDGVSSDSGVSGELELLDSKFASLALMQKMVQEKLEIVASLQSEIELLQESLDGKEGVSKSDRQAGELEKQVERLRKDIEMQNKKKDGLGARASIAENKIQKLNSKLQKLHNVNYEQENRIRKTEHLLQVAEEELMMAEVETDLISEGLNKAHIEWLPDWLSVHLDHIQLYMVSSWNESWGPAMDLSLQKALEKKAQFMDWVKLQTEMITVDWIPILKEQWSAFLTFLKPLVQSLTRKIAHLYHESKSSIAPYAFKVLKDLCSYAQDWIPILKEQWSTFMSSLQPRLQILAPTIVDVYHASKSFMAHVFKVLENLFSYTQEAKKFVEAYMPRIAVVTRSCFDKAFFVLKWYIVNLFRACWKFITVSTLFHHQVQGMLKNIAVVRPVANMGIVWFVATAFLGLPALFLFTLCSAVFRRTKKHIRSSNTNHTRRRSKQAHPDNLDRKSQPAQGKKFCSKPERKGFV